MTRSLFDIDIAIEFEGSTYTAQADLEGGELIYMTLSVDGITAGSAEWIGDAIAECDACLPEDAYVALDIAIYEELAS